ncbi:hypothetical protein HPB47_024693, partial [Ixodes persulcatus]
MVSALASAGAEKRSRVASSKLPAIVAHLATGLPSVTYTSRSLRAPALLLVIVGKEGSNPERPSTGSSCSWPESRAREKQCPHSGLPLLVDGCSVDTLVALPRPRAASVCFASGRTREPGFEDGGSELTGPAERFRAPGEGGCRESARRRMSGVRGRHALALPMEARIRRVLKPPTPSKWTFWHRSYVRGLAN